jgi:hypothetical protein
MSRALPDGDVLRWKLTLGSMDELPQIVPFLIDWGDTPHPSTSAARGVELLAFYGEAPDVARIQRELDALEVSLELRRAPAPRLVARLAGPRGEMTVKSS